MQLPIEEYFRYHPPTTPERIALHDRVNRETLEICKAFIESKNDVEVLGIRDAAMLLANKVCLDKTCNDWAEGAIEKASKIAASYLNKDIKTEAILMHVQQFRMFLNQGITVDQLVKKLESEQVGGGYLVSNKPYNYKGVWYSTQIYHQFDSVSYLKIKYCWTNPNPGNSQPGSKDWQEI